jgi:hypothetical protein
MLNSPQGSGRAPADRHRTLLDLPSSHLPRRSDRQLQYLAKCAQILIPWSYVIIFPKIDTRGADADLFGNFDNR